MFMGWALSAVFLPRLSDIYGRKKIFMFSIVLQSFAMLGMYLSKDLNLTTSMMFIFGMAAVGRTSISFLYLMELMPTNRQVLIGTILHVNNAAVGVFGCLYFWKISKNWLWLEIFAGSMGLLSAVAALILMPESPKFLISQKKYDKARDAVNRIAKFNFKPGFYGDFDREFQEKHNYMR
jgi:MFS family permease